MISTVVHRWGPWRNSLRIGPLIVRQMPGTKSLTLTLFDTVPLTVGLSAIVYSRVPKKTIVFHSCFLENSENFLNFAKSSKKFGEFLNFLEFSKIIENSLVLSYALLNFLDFF